MKRIKIFDTTLRDGEQSPGCSMNLNEKIEMARQLEKLGVDVIEAGFAIASPMDFKSVADDRLRRGERNGRLPRPLHEGRHRRRVGRGEGGQPSPHPRLPCHERHPHGVQAAHDAASRCSRRSRRWSAYAQFQVRGHRVLRRGRVPLRPRLPRPVLLQRHRGGRDDAERPRHRRLLHAAGDGGADRAICVRTSSARRTSTSPSTATTTSAWPSRTPSPASRRARRRWSAPSTASASARATPAWRRSSWRSRPRSDFYQAETGINTKQIYQSSKLPEQHHRRADPAQQGDRRRQRLRA